WRESLQVQLRDNDPEQVLFRGHPETFAEVVWQAWMARQVPPEKPAGRGKAGKGGTRKEKEAP
ncbi:hypothetical protein ACFMMZ_005495, partial [Salmonella enterica]|nr:hypothetical protein [Salmonella enterica subsp. enterica serovar Blockley]